MAEADRPEHRDGSMAASAFDAVAYVHDALHLAGWSVTDLWIAVLAVGGAFSRADIEELLSGARPLTNDVYDLLAVALNDCFVDRGLDHAMRYWDELSLE
jgi:hypothetical protein